MSTTTHPSVYPEDSQEVKQLLQDFIDGKVTTSELLGPLFGDTPGQTTTIKMRRGNKQKIPTAPETPIDPSVDAHNTKLVDNVHPTAYANPKPLDKYDLVVIGAGVSGLLSVIMGNALGKKCALIEEHYMGGDCLNVGCVPSKALISCAHAIHAVKTASKFGVQVPVDQVKIDFPAVMERMRKIRADISEHDSVARYSRDFCEHVFLGRATFIGDNKIHLRRQNSADAPVEELELTFDKAMIATGTTASIPPVPGLADTPHLTNAPFFNLTDQPQTLVVIGCGPIGLELAQSMHRFGTKVTCLEVAPQLLPREDVDAAQELHKALQAEGMDIRFGVRITKVEVTKPGNLTRAPFHEYKVHVTHADGKEEVITSDAVLNATGRVPNVLGLGLEKVNVDFDTRSGVHINEHFCTSNPNIYACGDVATAYRFTHSADFQARIAIRNAFLGDKNTLSNLLIPWCTYTDPEVAHVGKYESELKESGVEFETYVRPLPPVDRCRCDGVEYGFVKMSVRKPKDLADVYKHHGEILGATIVGPRAGDMISELTVCIQHGIGAGKVAGTIHPYPTTADAIRHCAGQFNKHYKHPDAVTVTRRILEAAQKPTQN